MRLAGSGSEKARGVATLGQFSPGAGGLVSWMSETTKKRTANGRAPPNKTRPIHWAASWPPIFWMNPRRTSMHREAPRRAGAGVSTYQRSVGGLYRMSLRQEGLSGAEYHRWTLTAWYASRRAQIFHDNGTYREGFQISGGPSHSSASRTAATQKLSSSVWDRRQASTWRRAQSITATRDRKPRCRGMSVTSVHHTWFGRVIGRSRSREGEIRCPGCG